MPNKKNFWAVNHNGKWGVKREGNENVSSTHATQQEAWEEARRRAKAEEGEAFLQNKEGQIRERNTYGNDPNPPEDKK